MDQHSIYHLRIPERAYNSLWAAKVQTIQQLERIPLGTLCNMMGAGEKSVAQICTELIRWRRAQKSYERYRVNHPNPE